MSDVKLKKVGWHHTLHMELGQKNVRLTTTKENPWGRRGVDYSPEYTVTSEPMYVVVKEAPNARD